MDERSAISGVERRASLLIQAVGHALGECPDGRTLAVLEDLAPRGHGPGLRRYLCGLYDGEPVRLTAAEPLRKAMGW